eukprot:2720298-Amphidinium_carterae.1
MSAYAFARKSRDMRSDCSTAVLVDCAMSSCAMKRPCTTSETPASTIESNRPLDSNCASRCAHAAPSRVVIGKATRHSGA